MKSTRFSVFFQFATSGLAIAFLFTGALGHRSSGRETTEGKLLARGRKP